MQFVTGITDRSHKLCFYKTVDVLGFATVQIILILAGSPQDFIESPADPPRFAFIQYSRADQRLGVSNARFDIGGNQTTIECERRVETREFSVRFACEPASPEFHPMQNTMAIPSNETEPRSEFRVQGSMRLVQGSSSAVRVLG